MFFFFFSSRRRHTRYWRDWSSDVCSSDLALPQHEVALGGQLRVRVDGDPARHSELAGEVAGGGQARARLERALPDRAPYPMLDLRAERPVAVAGDREEQLDRLTGLVLAMMSIALLVHAEHLTGSFAAAGIVTAAYAVSLGVLGPVLGQLVDRRGQTAVLLATALASAALLVAIAALPAGSSLPALVAPAIGAATPPVGACVRTALPAVLPDAGAVRAAYAVDATASELAWVSGPPLALALGALWSTGAALVAAGAVLL